MTSLCGETTESEQSPLIYDTTDEIAVLRIDNPPVNASTGRLRAAIISGLSRAAEATDVAAIILIGNERAFISGSDLTEFDRPVLCEPQLPQVIAAIERCPKPVIAALSGATLGGGFELALGCDARVADASTVVGLPEVSLGMIPGAGATQRLPRLIGIAGTIEMVTKGRRLTVQQALDIGIVDAVCDDHADLLDLAVDYARRKATKNVLLDRSVRADDVGSIEVAVAKAIGRLGARPQVVASIGATLVSQTSSATNGLAFERSEFHRLRLADEARALRYLFFAERVAGREYRGSNASHITTVGVVGAGTMGTGIARVFLDAGLSVVLMDAGSDALQAATRRLQQGYERAVARGECDEATARLRLDSLTTTMDYAQLGPCHLIVEAVYEDSDVKKAVLGQVDEVVGRDIPVATNTSYLDLDDLAASTANPGRVLGMHFFAPAHATKVLEIVRGSATSQMVVETAVALARGIKKTPVVAGAGFGFIGNRMFNAYRLQCELMLEEGALPRQVDGALEEFGFAMGPFTVADLSGLDIAWRMRQSTASQRDSRVRYVDITDLLCQQGRFGQKTGQGWYQYGSGSSQPVRDETVEELIMAESRRKGFARRPFTDEEIVRRAVLAMANEAACLLADGIAVRPSDIDVTMTLGYGFPRHRGGPVYWASRQERDALSADLERLRQATGGGYRIGDLDRLFEGVK